MRFFYREVDLWQATLENQFSLEGVGGHNGETCQIKVSPANEDSGIIFRKNGKEIPADYKLVSNTNLCTQISNQNGDSVKTIEHLCAALYGMGVSNAVVDVEGEEIPMLDGSSLEFVKAIERVGVRCQYKPRKVLKILKKVRITDGDKYEEFEPYHDFCVNISCDFEVKGLKTLPEVFDFSKDDFLKEIASARTFGFEEDAESIRKNNLALGASLANTVVYDSSGIPLNKGGLRFANESVKHKILDVIGDMSLSQYWIHGKFNCFCPSHKLNNMMLRLLLSNPENYEIL